MQQFADYLPAPLQTRILSPMVWEPGNRPAKPQPQRGIMPTTVEVTLYSFDELSEKAQEKAVEALCYINVDHDWWDSTYEDAAAIGLEITEFDTYRCTIDGKLTEYLPDCCKLIRRQHGKECETFKTAAEHLDAYIKAFKEWLPEQDKDGYEHWKPADWFKEFRYSDAADEITGDFTKLLLQDYLETLRREYEWQTSKDQIVQAIRANDYLFTESGKLY